METPQSQQAQVMTVKDWIITILISIIPLVGFVMLFVWAFGSNENPNRANWAKARLIWMVIGLVFVFILLALFWGTIAALIMAGSQGSQN
jgi:heme/copper-type cytochrome/quinol oxidase subunit 2